jgi:drug/metabolite transporter (DMT)-like permease
MFSLLPALPIVLGLATALVWGAADFTGGLATRRALPGRVVFVAHSTSLVLLLALTSLLHTPAASLRGMLWGLLSGVSGGIALMLFYEALALGGMGVSAALAGLLTAAVPVLLSWLTEGRPGSWQLAGFAVAAGAIGLIAYSPSTPEERGQPLRVRPLVLSCLAGLGFGVQLVVLHLASAHGAVLRALMLSRIGGAVAALGAVLLAAVRGRRVLPPVRGRRVLPPVTPMVVEKESRAGGWMAFLGLAALAGLLDASGNGLYMIAALAGRLDVAAVLSSLYPGATILLAAWLLKERTSRLQTIGMGLALAAVVLISL